MNRIASALAGVLLAAGLAGSASNAVAATPPDTVRVGGPSKPGDAKIAVVGSSRSLAGRSFRVLNAGGRTVLRGRLRRAAGSPAPWRFASTADLSRVTASGGFRVVVGRLRSRSWVVRPSGAQDATRAMLRYFAANADGAEPSPVHGPAHLNDAIVAAGPFQGRKFDFTGGWMDAGDMTHFTKTTAFAAMSLQLAARLDKANAAALNAAADVGIRWLVKAHPAPGLFIMQVADTRDHDVGFRDPAVDDRNPAPGIGQRLAYPGMGTDVGGKAAAALALAAARYGEPVRSALLAQARDWYQAGEAAGKIAGRPDGLVGAFVYNDEEEGGGEDDMATAGAFLFRATGDPQFLADAADHMKDIDSATPGWNSTGLLGAADLCGGLGLPAIGDGALKTLACDKLRAGAAAAQSVARRYAFPVFGEYGWGTTSTNGGGAATAGFAARAGIFGPGAGIADGGRDWLLGRNPWGASFIVGHGVNSPKHPHHWAVAYRGAGQPVGAVVGGPAPRSTVDAQKQNFTPKFRERAFNSRTLVYEDNSGNYVNSEPAIDYAANAILNLAVAG